MKSLEQIEANILSTVNDEKKTWVHLAELVAEVEKHQLFSPSFKSLTAWINDLSKRGKFSVSLVWKSVKAMKSITALKAAGAIAADLDVNEASMEHIELAHKINAHAKMSDSMKADLLDKAISGNVSKAELRDVWSKTKPKPTGTKDKPLSTSDGITAAGMLHGLRSQKSDDEWGKVFAYKEELNIKSPTSERARRVDLGILTERGIVGFEVKISLNDLESDGKMGDYRTGTHALFVAVPPELVAQALKLVSDDIGVVEVTVAGYTIRKRAIFKTKGEVFGDGAAIAATLDSYQQLSNRLL